MAILPNLNSAYHKIWQLKYKIHKSLNAVILIILNQVANSNFVHILILKDIVHRPLLGRFRQRFTWTRTSECDVMVTH